MVEPITTAIILTKLAGLLGVGKALLVVKLLLSGNISLAGVAAIKATILHGTATEILEAVSSLADEAAADEDVISDLSEDEVKQLNELSEDPDGTTGADVVSADDAIASSVATSFEKPPVFVEFERLAQIREPAPQGTGIIASVSELLTEDIVIEAVDEQLTELAIDGLQEVEEFLVEQLIEYGLDPHVASYSGFGLTFLIMDLPLPLPKPGREDDLDVRREQQKDAIRKGYSKRFVKQLETDGNESVQLREELQAQGFEVDRLLQIIEALEQELLKLEEEVETLSVEQLADILPEAVAKRMEAEFDAESGFWYPPGMTNPAHRGVYRKGVLAGRSGEPKTPEYTSRFYRRLWNEGYESGLVG
jgi:hypothetical protein